MDYGVLWDRLAGGIKIYVDNYILSKREKSGNRILIEPSYPVDYEIQNLEQIVSCDSAENYFLHRICECRNINDLPVELKELVSQYLPRFFAEYPKYKDEKCLKINP